MNKFDWQHIRILYESGSTAYQLSKRPDFPSKQGIENRAKKEGWVKQDPTVTNRLPIVAKALTIDSHKLTDEVLQVVLDMVSEGATVEVACATAGISYRTWAHWCTQDVRLKDAVTRARAGTIASWMGTVHNAARKDWKPATWLLTNSPDTRDHFGAQKADNKVEVVINIDRTVNA